MREKINKIFVGIFAGVLLLPSIGLAGLKLQQNYPAISGITGQSESLNTAVSQTAKNAPMNTVSLIKYLFTLATIVLIGLATLAVIISGVQYLSSAGKVTAQKSARTRLLRAFLGLAIVITAALIMQLISPNLEIPKLTHIYDSASNVILITQTGLGNLGKLNNADITKEYLDQLADEGEIKYFGSQSGDLTQNFGQLTKYADPKISFEDFQPAYIGFFGKGKNNIQVKAFSGKNFLGASHTYKAEDSNKEIGAIGWEGEKIIYFDLPTYSSEASNIEYFDVATQLPVNPKKEDSINYPPLSMSVEGISAGVYLYGSDTPITVQAEDQTPNVVGDVDTSDYIKTVGGRGGQRYLQYDIPNFSDTSFDFDNEAMEIEIKNNRQADPSAQDDLLVFLFQGKYYQGPFRAFFEKKIKVGQKNNKVPIANLFDFPNEPKWYSNRDNIQSIKDVFIDPDKNSFPRLQDKIIGNTTEKEKKDINGIDQQGKVWGASSARIFHLAELDESSLTYKNSCDAVALCNAENLQGYCLVFTANGKSNGMFMSFFMPMPWFTPIPLPERFDEWLKDALLATPEQIAAYTIQKGTKGFKDNTEFNDNIKSIGIKGNCVVALYDNAVKDFQKCLNGTLDDCWDNKTPGAKSMIFSNSDMISGTGYRQMNYLNLKNYQIHSCVSLWSALRLTPPHSCVSAIAVYPIK